MKLRLAWLGEGDSNDSCSAQETRFLLYQLAKNPDLVLLWFAIGSNCPPHFWDGIRVFPIPKKYVTSAEFFRTLVAQQRPDAVISDLSAAELSKFVEFTKSEALRWIRLDLSESSQEINSGSSRRSLPYTGKAEIGENNSRLTRNLGAIERKVQELIQIMRSRVDTHVEGLFKQPHLIMRQHMFENSSLSHVMFELTNSLLEIGIPTVPQEEHRIFCGANFHREEELFRLGAPEKYERILRHLKSEFSAENSTTIHFALLRSELEYSVHNTFPALTGREVLYVTGNHTVSQSQLESLKDQFQMILAPSEHVLRPYSQAGLDPEMGAVIPHGIDPLVYSPKIEPFQYPTKKRFKFLQTSFPWIFEKGFDLTVKAFSQAFSRQDDVCLILRVPRIRSQKGRERTVGRLEALVKEQHLKADSPEIVLLEMDLGLCQRGGMYTGANCYVHPSRAEGFGMTILEAMACGLPVIATAWSGPADFLSPKWAYTLRYSGLKAIGDGSYYVEAELDHLIYVMRYAYEHELEGRLLGKRASNLAHDQWTWKHAAAKLASLLSPLVPVLG